MTALTDARYELLRWANHPDPEAQRERRSLCNADIGRLLAAHLAELAGEPETEMLEKAYVAVRYLDGPEEHNCTFAAIGGCQIGRECGEWWRALLLTQLEAAAPILRAPLVAENQQLKAALEAVGIGFIEGEGWYYTCEPHGEVPSEDGSLRMALQAAMSLKDEVVPPQPPNKYEETLAAYRQVNLEVGAENQQLRDRVRELEERLEDIRQEGMDRDLCT